MSVARRAAFGQRIASTGLYGFCLFAWLGVAGAKIGLAFMVLAALAEPGRLMAVLRPARPILALATAYAVVLGAGLWRNGWDPAHVEAASDLMALWAFLIPAYWLDGSERRVRRALGVALIGFLLGRGIELDAGTLSAVLAGRRTGLGLPELAFGQYTATAVLGVLLFAPRMRRWAAGHGALQQGVVVALLICSLGVLLYGLILSYARGVWLALVITVIFLAFSHFRRYGGRRSRWLLVGLGLPLALAAVVGWEVVGERLAQERGAFAKILSGNLAEVGVSSVGIRVHMIEFGFRSWLERPILGWGPGATPELLQQSATAALNGFDDLHNILVGSLVRAGGLGTALMAIGVAIVALVLRRARLAGRIGEDTYLVLLGALLLHVLCGMSNFRMLNTDWRFYWYLFAGCAYTFALFPPTSRQGMPATGPEGGAGAGLAPR